MKDKAEGASGEARSPDPTPEEMNVAREAMQEAFSITVAAAHDSGRGWPEEAHLHPIVNALRAAEARRDALWREALRQQDEKCPLGMDTILSDWMRPDDDPYLHGCAACAPLRALLGAAEAQPPPSPAAVLVEQQEGQQGAAAQAERLRGEVFASTIAKLLREWADDTGDPEHGVGCTCLLHGVCDALAVYESGSGEPPARPPAPAAAALATSREGLVRDALEALRFWLPDPIPDRIRPVLLDRVNAALASLDRAAQEQQGSKNES